MTARMDAAPDSDTLGPATFEQLGLPPSLLRALKEVGYEQPSPIQAQTIPIMMARRDLIGQAQTGTGKTAAFALPILAQIDPTVRGVQALVLAPTRELAIQVAEAFQKYASHIPDFHVAPIYGGSGYGPQLHALKRGAQVVVGTPGRVIDHLDKGTLKLDNLRVLVLDEADEMLRMGFIDDVETVLKKSPAGRQVALFSATMPPPIKKISQKYLKDAEHIAIASVTRTADRIRARVLFVSPAHKLEAFTRLLEVENFEGMIAFVRTKSGSEELADKLAARGFAAAAINGDLAQNQRERVIEKLKNGQLDILVATDVAARGLDVERITHVVNYDLPNDAESYVHRIGRTGRAGRSGDAILFATQRERGWLKVIERSTKQTIEIMSLPSIEAVNDRRVAKLIERVATRMGEGNLEPWRDLMARLEQEMMVSSADLAAVFAALFKGDSWMLKLDHDPLRAAELRDRERNSFGERDGSDKPRRDSRAKFDQPARETGRGARAPRESSFERTSFEKSGFDKGAKDSTRSRIEKPSFDDAPPKRSGPRKQEPGMRSFRVEVGHIHRVKPGNLVGAIANEIGLDAKEIGRIEIESDHTVLDLPDDLTKAAILHLQKVIVAGRPLAAVPLDEYKPSSAPSPWGEKSSSYDRGAKLRREDDSRPSRGRSDRSGGYDRGDRAPSSRAPAGREQGDRAKPKFGGRKPAR